MKRTLGFAGVLLAATAAMAQITVTTPQNNGTVGVPAQFTASAHSETDRPITAMRIYVDNNSVYATNHGSLDTPVTMAAGRHSVMVQAWDGRGQIYYHPMTLTVANVPPPPPPPPGLAPPPNAQSFTNIEQMSGWQSCDSCAGPGGQGPHIPHTMTQHQATPSLDGNSSRFWIGGNIPYSQALWWKQLGPHPDASNFIYDLYFYVQDANASQALEFDVNQTVNGKWFIFGTECNYNGTHQWDVWNNATKHWNGTGIACTRPSAYHWHHLVWNFQRTREGKVSFIAITLDGHTSYVNRSSFPLNSNGHQLSTAFQMDGNNRPVNYSTWLDKVTLFYW